MMPVTILFRCGHELSIDPDQVSSPVCACGERQIARVVKADRPVFRGVATGPCCETTNLPAIAVNLGAPNAQ